MALDSYLLDTSAYSAFVRGDESLRSYFSSKANIVVPIIVVGELRAGFAAGNRQQENESKLQLFLDSPNVTVQKLTDTTTLIYAGVFAKLKAAGTPINTNDMWIAAVALELDLPILTLDSDFARVPDLLIAKL